MMKDDADATAKSNLSIVYFHRATTYYKAKQFGSAFASFQKAAEYNHIEGIGSLANFYYDGVETVKQNYSKALELYEKAATLGHPLSQYRAGLMYFEGRGTEPKYIAALNWLVAASDNNQTQANAIIGEIYYNGGHGIEKDYEKALYWFLKNAQDINCQEKIALIYREGHGSFKRDWKKARLWYTNSANAGNPNSQYDLGSFYLRGDLDMEIDVLKSIKWFTMAFNQGDIKSMVCLGIIYLFGFNEAKKDRKKAFYYFNTALEKDENDAQANLYMGEFYSLDSKPDYAKAIKHYLKAANARDGDAANALGKIYESGHGVDIDYEKAKQWYKMAVKIGSEDAEENLARVKAKLNQIKPVEKKLKVDIIDSPQPTKQTVKSKIREDSSSLQKELELLRQKLESSEKTVAKLTKELNVKNQEIEKKDREKEQIVADKDEQINQLKAEKEQLQKFQMQLVLDFTTKDLPDKKRRIEL